MTLLVLVLVALLAGTTEATCDTTGVEAALQRCNQRCCGSPTCLCSARCDTSTSCLFTQTCEYYQCATDAFRSHDCTLDVAYSNRYLTMAVQETNCLQLRANYGCDWPDYDRAVMCMGNLTCRSDLSRCTPACYADTYVCHRTHGCEAYDGDAYRFCSSLLRDDALACDACTLPPVSTRVTPAPQGTINSPCVGHYRRCTASLNFINPVAPPSNESGGVSAVVIVVVVVSVIFVVIVAVAIVGCIAVRSVRAPDAQPETGHTHHRRSSRSHSAGRSAWTGDRADRERDREEEGVSSDSLPPHTVSRRPSRHRDRDRDRDRTRSSPREETIRSRRDERSGSRGRSSDRYRNIEISDAGDEDVLAQVPGTPIHGPAAPPLATTPEASTPTNAFPRLRSHRRTNSGGTVSEASTTAAPARRTKDGPLPPPKHPDSGANSTTSAILPLPRSPGDANRYSPQQSSAQQVIRAQISPIQGPSSVSPTNPPPRPPLPAALAVSFGQRLDTTFSTMGAEEVEEVHEEVEEIEEEVEETVTDYSGEEDEEWEEFEGDGDVYPEGLVDGDDEVTDNFFAAALGGVGESVEVEELEDEAGHKPEAPTFLARPTNAALIEMEDKDIVRHIRQGVFTRGRFLGRGNNGAVYIASFPNGFELAVKDIDFSELSDVDLEANLADYKRHKSLRHENLAKCYAVAVDMNTRQVQVWMELMRGGTIQQLARRKAMGSSHFTEKLSAGKEPVACVPDKFVAFFVKQLVQGLHYLHGLNIVHGDIKGSNVMLNRDFKTAKLVDFGTARVVSGLGQGAPTGAPSNSPPVSLQSGSLNSGSGSGGNNTSNSQQGGTPSASRQDDSRSISNQPIVGTPQWMAPELISDVVEHSNPGTAEPSPSHNPNGGPGVLSSSQDAPRPVRPVSAQRRAMIAKGELPPTVTNSDGITAFSRPPSASGRPGTASKRPTSAARRMQRVQSASRRRRRRVAYKLASDVWSVGITVLELLLGGVAPYPAFESNWAAIFALGSGNVAPLIPRGTISAECADFIDLCLVRDPLQRATTEQLLNHPWIKGAQYVA